MQTGKTPLAVVLGGNHQHRVLLRKLRQQGFQTLLVDYFENPPARSAADRHIRESALDKDVVLSVAREADANVVISACIDQAMVTACWVAERLGLPAPFGYQTALDVTNKANMKAIMSANRIPTSRYCVVTRGQAQSASGLDMPVVIKPVEGSGSLGITTASTASELDARVLELFGESDVHAVVIEEFKQGTEIQIDSVVRDGCAHTVLAREKYKARPGLKAGMQSVGSIAPVDLAEITWEKFQRIQDGIVEAFGLENTPLLLQAIVDDRGEITVLEFSPRVGGGVSCQLLEAAAGFDPLAAVIDSYLGRPITLPHNPVHGYFATHIIHGMKGVLGEIRGADQLIASGIIESFFPLKAPGASLDGRLTSRGRIGVVTVRAESRAGAIQRIEEAIERIDVLDTDGASIMRQDVFDAAMLLAAKPAAGL